MSSSSSLIDILRYFTLRPNIQSDDLPYNKFLKTCEIPAIDSQTINTLSQAFTESSSASNAIKQLKDLFHFLPSELITILQFSGYLLDERQNMTTILIIFKNSIAFLYLNDDEKSKEFDGSPTQFENLLLILKSLSTFWDPYTKHLFWFLYISILKQNISQISNSLELVSTICTEVESFMLENPQSLEIFVEILKIVKEKRKNIHNIKELKNNTVVHIEQTGKHHEEEDNEETKRALRDEDELEAIQSKVYLLVQKIITVYDQEQINYNEEPFIESIKEQVLQLDPLALQVLQLIAQEKASPSVSFLYSQFPAALIEIASDFDETKYIFAPPRDLPEAVCDRRNKILDKKKTIDHKQKHKSDNDDQSKDHHTEKHEDVKHQEDYTNDDDQHKVDANEKDHKAEKHKHSVKHIQDKNDDRYLKQKKKVDDDLDNENGDHSDNDQKKEKSKKKTKSENHFSDNLNGPYPKSNVAQNLTTGIYLPSQYKRQIRNIIFVFQNIKSENIDAFFGQFSSIAHQSYKNYFTFVYFLTHVVFSDHIPKSTFHALLWDKLFVPSVTLFNTEKGENFENLPPQPANSEEILHKTSNISSLPFDITSFYREKAIMIIIVHGPRFIGDLFQNFKHTPFLFSDICIRVLKHLPNVYPQSLTSKETIKTLIEMDMLYAKLCQKARLGKLDSIEYSTLLSARSAVFQLLKAILLSPLHNDLQFDLLFALFLDKSFCDSLFKALTEDMTMPTCTFITNMLNFCNHTKPHQSLLKKLITLAYKSILKDPNIASPILSVLFNYWKTDQNKVLLSHALDCIIQLTTKARHVTFSKDVLSKISYIIPKCELRCFDQLFALLAMSEQVKCGSYFIITNPQFLVTVFSVFIAFNEQDLLFSEMAKLTDYSSYNSLQCYEGEVDLLLLDMIYNYPDDFEFRGSLIKNFKNEEELFDKTLPLFLKCASTKSSCIVAERIIKIIAPRRNGYISPIAEQFIQKVCPLVDSIFPFIRTRFPIGIQQPIFEYKNIPYSSFIPASTITFTLFIDQFLSSRITIKPTIFKISLDQSPFMEMLIEGTSLICTIYKNDEPMEVAVAQNMPTNTWNYITIRIQSPSKNILEVNTEIDLHDRTNYIHQFPITKLTKNDTFNIVVGNSTKFHGNRGLLTCIFQLGTLEFYDTIISDENAYENWHDTPTYSNDAPPLVTSVSNQTPILIPMPEVSIPHLNEKSVTQSEVDQTTNSKRHGSLNLYHNHKQLLQQPSTSTHQCRPLFAFPVIHRIPKNKVELLVDKRGLIPNMPSLMIIFRYFYPIERFVPIFDAFDTYSPNYILLLLKAFQGLYGQSISRIFAVLPYFLAKAGPKLSFDHFLALYDYFKDCQTEQDTFSLIDNVLCNINIWIGCKPPDIEQIIHHISTKLFFECTSYFLQDDFYSKFIGIFRLFFSKDEANELTLHNTTMNFEKYIFFFDSVFLDRAQIKFVEEDGNVIIKTILNSKDHKLVEHLLQLLPRLLQYSQNSKNYFYLLLKVPFANNKQLLSPLIQCLKVVTDDFYGSMILLSSQIPQGFYYDSFFDDIVKYIEMFPLAFMLGLHINRELQATLIEVYLSFADDPSKRAPIKNCRFWALWPIVFGLQVDRELQEKTALFLAKMFTSPFDKDAFDLTIIVIKFFQTTCTLETSFLTSSLLTNVFQLTEKSLDSKELEILVKRFFLAMRCEFRFGTHSNALIQLFNKSVFNSENVFNDYVNVDETEQTENVESPHKSSHFRHSSKRTNIEVNPEDANKNSDPLVAYQLFNELKTMDCVFRALHFEEKREIHFMIVLTPVNVNLRSTALLLTEKIHHENIFCKLIEALSIKDNSPIQNIQPYTILLKSHSSIIQPFLQSVKENAMEKRLSMQTFFNGYWSTIHCVESVKHEDPLIALKNRLANWAIDNQNQYRNLIRRFINSEEAYRLDVNKGQNEYKRIFLFSSDFHSTVIKKSLKTQDDTYKQSIESKTFKQMFIVASWPCIKISISKSKNCIFYLVRGKFVLEIEKKKHVIIKASEIRSILTRNRIQKPTAIEFFTTDGRSYLLDFAPLEANEIIKKCKSVRMKNLIECEDSDFASFISQSNLVQNWQQRRITNFEFLMKLNMYIGRSFKDPDNYPIFPFVDEIDQQQRDFSLPMPLQDSKRVFHFFQIVEMNNYLFGTAPSNAMLLSYYFLRLEPYTALHKSIHDGHFDAFERMFRSYSTFQSSLVSEDEWKECTPEFYTFPEIFMDLNRVVHTIKATQPQTEQVQFENESSLDPKTMTSAVLNRSGSTILIKGKDVIPLSFTRSKINSSYSAPRNNYYHNFSNEKKVYNSNSDNEKMDKNLLSDIDDQKFNSENNCNYHRKDISYVDNDNESTNLNENIKLPHHSVFNIKSSTKGDISDTSDESVHNNSDNSSSSHEALISNNLSSESSENDHEIDTDENDSSSSKPNHNLSINTTPFSSQGNHNSVDLELVPKDIENELKTVSPIVHIKHDDLELHFNSKSGEDDNHLVNLTPHLNLETNQNTLFDFVYQNRKILESDYVSQHLCEWINLIWGVNQKNKGGNLWLPYLYHNCWDSTAETETAILPTILKNLGSIPPQVFNEKISKRKKIDKSILLHSLSDNTGVIIHEMVKIKIEKAKNKMSRQAFIFQKDHIIRLIVCFDDGTIQRFFANLDKKEIKPVYLEPLKLRIPTEAKYVVQNDTVFIFNIKSDKIHCVNFEQIKTTNVKTMMIDFAAGLGMFGQFVTATKSGDITLWKYPHFKPNLLFSLSIESISAIEINRQYGIMVCCTNDGYMRTYSVAKKEILNIVHIGCIAEKILVTTNMGFIIIYSPGYLYLFTINCFLIKKCPIEFEISQWCTFRDNIGFDYVCCADPIGYIYSFEAYSLEKIFQIAACHERIISVFYGDEVHAIVAHAATSKVYFISYDI